MIENPDSLGDHIRRVFTIAREAVDTELANHHPNNGRPEGSVSGTDTSDSGGKRHVRAATLSQIRAIRSIARQKQLDPDCLANERYGTNGVEELNIREASSLIDELKQNGQATSRTGGGR